MLASNMQAKLAGRFTVRLEAPTITWKSRQYEQKWFRFRSDMSMEETNKADEGDGTKKDGPVAQFETRLGHRHVIELLPAT